MDEIDIRNKLDQLYRYQLGAGSGCSLAAALKHIGLAKSTYDTFDDALCIQVKQTVFEEIRALRTADEQAQIEARAQQELEISRDELRLRKRAVGMMDKIMDRMETIIDNSVSDFNAVAAAGVVDKISRYGLQPDKGNNKIVLEAPAQPQPALTAPRQLQQLAMPGEIPPARALEVTTQAKYPDGTITQTTVTGRTYWTNPPDVLGEEDFDGAVGPVFLGRDVYRIDRCDFASVAGVPDILRPAVWIHKFNQISDLDGFIIVHDHRHAHLPNLLKQKEVYR